MSKRITTYAASLEELADVIRKNHSEAATSLRLAVLHAITAGEALIEAKKQVKHGEWLPWLSENCEISERAAQGYMRLARLPVEKRAAVADLPLREALSAIKSREQKLADAEAREAQPAGRAEFVVVGPNGEILKGAPPHFDTCRHRQSRHHRRQSRNTPTNVLSSSANISSSSRTKWMWPRFAVLSGKSLTDPCLIKANTSQSSAGLQRNLRR